MKSFIKNEDIIRYLNKTKSLALIFGCFVLVFLLALVLIDAKESAPKKTVSVIGAIEEKIYKDAQFSLDFVAYGLNEEDAKKKIDDKVIEIKGSVENFDEIIIGKVKTDVTVECIVSQGQYYQAQTTENGVCLSNNWRAQSRIKILIKGNKYTEKIKNKFLSLAPNIVNTASGPVFIKKEIDDEFKELLIEKAMANAEVKASKMATESNKKLGEVIRINEDPIVNNNLMSVRSEDKVILGPGEDLVKKEILVEYELEN